MIKKNIPNAITCCNLISGCVATVFAFSGQPATAFLFIVTGAVFDFFDGMSARLLGVSSPIGKELDSLADCVTFGVAPSTLAYSLLCVLDYPLWLEAARPVLPFAAYLMAAFSALRLAKFNLDERQTSAFIGLPTPANALFWGSVVLGFSGLLESSEYMVFAVLALILLSCYIMVAELPLFALKFKHLGWRGNEVKYVFVLTCIPLLVIFRLSAPAIIVVWYVLLSAYQNRKSLKDDNIPA